MRCVLNNIKYYGYLPNLAFKQNNLSHMATFIIDFQKVAEYKPNISSISFFLYNLILQTLYSYILRYLPYVVLLHAICP